MPCSIGSLLFGKTSNLKTLVPCEEEIELGRTIIQR